MGVPSPRHMTFGGYCFVRLRTFSRRSKSPAECPTRTKELWKSLYVLDHWGRSDQG